MMAIPPTRFSALPRSLECRRPVSPGLVLPHDRPPPRNGPAVTRARDPFELVLTPAGQLLLPEGPIAERRASREPFGDPSAGLLALVARRPEVPPAPSFAFWRDFAALYLGRLCRTPESEAAASPLEPPAPAPARNWPPSAGRRARP